MELIVALFLVVANPPEAGAVEASDEGDAAVEHWQEMSLAELLDTVVVSATKTTATFAQAPAIVKLVTQRDIQRWGYQSLAEILQHLPEFYITDDHILQSAAVRGISGGFMSESSQIKVLINGHSVAFRPTGGNWLGKELIPITMVDRIEIVLGPVSALYGSDAFLAVINVITTDVTESVYRANAGLAQVGNNLGGYDLELTVADQFGSNGFYNGGVRLTLEDRSGLQIPADSPSVGNPIYDPNKRRVTGLKGKSWVAMLQVGYKISEDTSISVSPYYSAISRGGEFASWSLFQHEIDSEGRQRGTTIDLQKGALSIDVNSKLTKTLAFSLSTTAFAGAPNKDDRIDVGSQLYAIERNFYSVGQDTVLQLNWEVLDTLTIMSGAEFNLDYEKPLGMRYIAYQDVAGVRSGDTIDALTIDRKPLLFSNGAAFAQAAWRPYEQYLQVTAAVRMDYHNIYGAQPSGRLALVSTPSPPVTVKLTYGTAYKAPSALLLYAHPLNSQDIIGNPGLRPQRVHTVELGTLWAITPQFSFAGSLAYNHLLDAARFMLNGVNMRAQNVATVQTATLEGTLRYETPDFSTYVAYGLVVGQRDLGSPGYANELLGHDIELYPHHSANVGISGKIPYTGGFRGSLEGIFVGERRASELHTFMRGDAYYLPSYVLLGVTLRSPEFNVLGKRTTFVSLKGSNLLNQKGPEPGFSGVDYPLAPITFMLILDHRV